MKHLVGKLEKLSKIEEMLGQALPFFRSSEERVEDVVNAVLGYEKNGMAAYLAQIPEPYNEEARAEFRKYTELLVTRCYWTAMRTSELNDSIDRGTTVIEGALDATGVGHLPAWVLRLLQIPGPIAALCTQWYSTIKYSKYFGSSAKDQLIYLSLATLGLGAVESAELLPVAGAFIGPPTDLFNLYIGSMNGVIARGVSPRLFEAYLSKANSGLYSKIGG